MLFGERHQGRISPVPTVAAVLFAMALSMDALLTGAVYGLRHIRVPWPSLALIGATSTAAVALSIATGHVFSLLVAPELARKAGGVILIGLGIWVATQEWREEYLKNRENRPVLSVRIRSLGVVVQILYEPHRADLDRSGVICPAEALLLGLALAVDAFVGGFAVAMLGLHPVLTALAVGVCQPLCLCAGVLVGHRLPVSAWSARLALVPGFILIAFGLSRLS